MNNTGGITDEELVARFRSGDVKAGERLLSEYKNKVLAIARRFFLSGGETEDLVQEGMCGLYSAMTSFDASTGFSAYANACIRNRIVDAVKKSQGNKNAALNDFDPIEYDEELLDESKNPENAVIYDEERKEFLSKIKAELSPLEYKAVTRYMDGATMAEISSALGKTYKQTDNAISRAKRKLQVLFKG